MQRTQTLVELNQEQFTTVYQFAKERNLKALQDWEADGQNLDVSIGQFTVTGQFAFEGNHEVVNFMLTHFHLDRNYVTWAYARAGHFDYLSTLGPVNPTRVATGAAQRGDSAWVSAMMDYAVDLGQIIQGYAKGGYTVQVEELISIGPVSVPVILNCPGPFIEAAILDLRPHILSAAFGYACEGHDDLLEKLLQKATELDKTDALDGYNRHLGCLSKAGLAYAQIGKRDKAETMIKRGASLSEVATGAAIYGDTEYVEALLARGAKMDAALEGYYTRWSFFNEESALQLLAFTANNKIRADLAEAAHHYNKNINPQNLLTKAHQLHSLMHNQGLTYNNVKRFLAEQKRLGLFSQLKPIVVHANQEETLQLKPR